MKLLKTTDNIVKNYYIKVSKYILYEEELRKMSIGAKLLICILTRKKLYNLQRSNKILELYKKINIFLNMG